MGSISAQSARDDQEDYDAELLAEGIEEENKSENNKSDGNDQNDEQD